MDLGRYETVSRIGQSGVTIVWAARGIGQTGAPKFGLKVIEPPVGIWSDEERSRRLAAFKERTRLQSLLAKPGGHWAPIHDSAVGHDAGWYATDFYPRSAEFIWHNRATQLNSIGLHRIVTGIVRGLKEIQETANRTHGNLVPGNVLLAGARANHSRVFLIDPMPDAARAKASGVEADLRALGVIIHALVLHELPGDAPTVAVPPSRAWAALGADGEAWRDLCARLLGGSPAITTLEELDLPLSKLGKSRAPRMIGMVAALILLIGGGSFGWFWTHREKCVFNPHAWTQLCDSYNGWFGAFDEALGDPAGGSQLRQLCAQDPQLKLLADRFTPDHPRDPHRIAKRPLASLESLKTQPPSDARSCTAIEQTSAALDLVLATNRAFSRWALVDTLKNTSGGKKASKLAFFQNLSAASEQLKEIDVPGHDATQNKEIFKAIVTLLNAKQAIEQVKKIQENLEILEGSNDKTLIKIASLMSEQFNIVMLNDEFPISETRKLQTSSDELTAICKTWTWDGRKINVETFHKEHEREPDAPFEKMAAAWLSHVKNYAELVPTEDPRTTALGELKKRSANATADSAAIVEQLKVNAGLDEDQKLLDKRAKAVKPIVDRLEENPKFSKDLPQMKLDLEDLAREVAAWEADVKRIGPIAARRQEDWAAEVRKELVILPKAPQEVNAVWVKRRDAILTSAQTYQQKFDAIAATRSFFLKTLNAPFETSLQIVSDKDAAWASRKWGPALQTEARRQHDKAMIAALKNDGGAGSGSVVPGDVEKEQAAFKAWATKAVDVAKTADALELALDRGYLPEEAPPGATASLQALFEGWQTVTKDAGLTQVMQSVSNRMGAVMAMEQPSTPALAVEAAAVSDELSVARAAWKQMGHPTTRSLAIDFKASEQLAKLIAGLPETEGARKTQLAQAVALEAKNRWKERLHTAPTTGAVDEAIAFTEKFHASEADFKDDAPAQFNWKLFRFRAQAFDATKPKDDDSVRTAITQFQLDIGGIKALAENADVQKLIAQMDLLKKNTGAPDLNTVGPPPEEWDRLPSETEGVLLFKQRRPLGGAPPLTLTFIQLPKSNTYLLATEVPVGLFAAVDAVSNHALLPLLENKGQTAGIRTWTLTPNGKNIVPNSDWFSAIGDVPKPQRFFKPVPDFTMLSPMNHVSPKAAAVCAEKLRCRLPTVEDWTKGYEIESKEPNVTWNLRDKTWVAQQDYLKKRIEDAIAAGRERPTAIPQLNDFIFVWPFDPANGIEAGRNRRADFDEPGNPWHGSGTNIVESSSTLPVYDDGELLFTEVTYAFNRAGKPRLCDLVGNVAEIVKDKQGAYVVIGGSAFSAPSKVDVPEPATRGAGPIPPIGWSDVGFRLALEGARPLIAQLQDELSNLPYQKGDATR